MLNDKTRETKTLMEFEVRRDIDIGGKAHIQMLIITRSHMSCIPITDLDMSYIRITALMTDFCVVCHQELSSTCCRRQSPHKLHTPNVACCDLIVMACSQFI